MKKDNKNEKNIIPVFTALATAEKYIERDRETKIAEPSDSAVKQAKDWVESNKL